MQHVNTLQPEEKEKACALWDTSRDYFHRAAELFDTILADINKRSWFKRIFSYRFGLKAGCLDHKFRLLDKLEQLERWRKKLARSMDFDKAHLLCQEGKKRADLAIERESKCSYKIDNTEEVVRILNEAATLYDEGAAHMSEALLLVSHANKVIIFLQECIEQYKERAEACRRRGQGESR